MGTRADFYVGRGKDATWLGSIAWDGFPKGNPASVLKANTQEEYEQRVQTLLGTLDHATKPEMGWPWPWDDSSLTDYAYAWDQGKILVSVFGSPWFLAGDENPSVETPEAIFPDMSAKKKVTLGERSGLITFGLPEEEK